MSSLLEARGISKSFGPATARISVLRDTDLAIASGEMVAVVGASGSGKTTLLQILGTLDAPDSGSLHFKGTQLTGRAEPELAEHRNRNIGFIFQFHHLLPEFSALENVMMPGLIAGRSKAALHERAVSLLARVNLDHRLHHRSGELSGGEQQRVALVRALIMEPALLLADEPTGNLDANSGRLVFQFLSDLSRTMGLSVVMVTHNRELAEAMDRTLTLDNGRLSQG